jgi:chromosome segregation ATPase
MTADEVRKSLEPMKNFAPAVLAAAEILESFEHATKELAETDKVKTALGQDIARARQELDSLRASKTSLPLEIDRSKTELRGVRQELVEKKAELVELEKKVEAANAVLARAAKARELLGSIAD